ncbi:hypothetical protein ACFZDP_50655, partial [Streptomyces mirabilis]
EPLACLVPDPLAKPPPLSGQSTTLRVPHTTDLPQGSPHVTTPDNNPKRSVTRGPACERAGPAAAWLSADVRRFRRRLDATDFKKINTTATSSQKIKIEGTVPFPTRHGTA